MPPKAGPSRSKKTLASRKREEFPSLEVWDEERFISMEAQLTWRGYLKRKIEVGRNAMVPEMEPLHVRHYFEQFCWLSVVDIGFDICYPRLVREFYCNFKLLHPGTQDVCFTTRVKGRSFSMNVIELGKATGINTDGLWHYQSQGEVVPFLTPEVKAEVYRTLCPKTKGRRKPSENECDPIPRVLSRIIGHNILPIGGHRTAVKEFHLYVAYCILTGKLLCLPYIVLMCMANAAARHTREAPPVLPYGALLTRVFKFARVNLSGEDRKSVKLLDKTTVKKMGMKDKVAALETDEADTTAPSESSGDESPPPRKTRRRSAGSSSSHIHSEEYETLSTQMTSLAATFEKGFAELGNKYTASLDYFKAEQDRMEKGLKADIQSLREEQKSFQDEQKSFRDMMKRWRDDSFGSTEEEEEEEDAKEEKDSKEAAEKKSKKAAEKKSKKVAGGSQG